MHEILRDPPALIIDHGLRRVTAVCWILLFPVSCENDSADEAPPVTLSSRERKAGEGRISKHESRKVVDQESQVHTLEGRLKVMEVFLVDPGSEVERMEIMEHVRERLTSLEVLNPVRGFQSSIRSFKPTIDSYIIFQSNIHSPEHHLFLNHYMSSNEALDAVQFYRRQGLGLKHPKVLKKLEESSAFLDKARREARPFWESFQIQAKGSEAQRDVVLPLLSDPRLKGDHFMELREEAKAIEKALKEAITELEEMKSE